MAVTGVKLSFDESLLISSSEDGKCIVWDPSTRQILRTFGYHKGFICEITKGAVTTLDIILQPSNFLDASTTIKQPLPFKRFPEGITSNQITLKPFDEDMYGVKPQALEANKPVDLLTRQINHLKQANEAIYTACLETLNK